MDPDPLVGPSPSPVPNPDPVPNPVPNPDPLVRGMDHRGSGSLPQMSMDPPRNTLLCLSGSPGQDERLDPRLCLEGQ